MISPKELSPATIKSFIETTHEIKVINPPELMLGGTENAGWLVETAENKYVAKVFSQAGERISSIYDELYLYEYLLANGVHAPEVVKPKTGSPVNILVADGFEYPVVTMRLERLKRLSPSEITLPEVELLAETVAQMHKIFQTYPRKDQIAKMSLPLSPSVVSDGFDDLIFSPNVKVFHENELETLRITDERLVSYIKMQTISTPTPLKESILHGDLSLGHARFLPDGSIYLFDFSDFSFGPIIWELATMLSYFYKEGGVSIGRWLEIGSHFFNQYKRHMSLTSNDIDALHYCLIDRLLFEIRTLNNISRREHILADAEGNKNRYNLARFLIDHHLSDKLLSGGM